MIDPNSPCAACGGSALGGFTFPTGFISFPDVEGAHYCPGCVKRYTTLGAMAEAIRDRRSAPQPPVDADGAPLSVGDRCFHKEDPGDPGTIERVTSDVEGMCIINYDRDGRKYAMPSCLRHLPPPTAQSDEGGEEKAYCETNGHTFDPTQADCAVCGVGAPAIAAPSLAAFTAAVDRELKPYLPSSFKLITDMVFNGRRMVPLCWVYDGSSLVHEFGGWPFEAAHARCIADDIARIMLSRLARPASEKSR